MSSVNTWCSPVLLRSNSVGLFGYIQCEGKLADISVSGTRHELFTLTDFVVVYPRRQHDPGFTPPDVDSHLELKVPASYQTTPNAP